MRNVRASQRRDDKLREKVALLTLRVAAIERRLTKLAKLLGVAVLLSLASAVPAVAQHLGHGASGLPHGIPDFCAEPGSIVVASGETRTFTGGDASCLGVHGTAILQGSRVLDVLLVYADGAVECKNGAEIIIRDKAIDTVKDPEQFGQGVIGFGKVTFNGCVIRSQNPQGVRGHVLLTQRADIDIRNSRFLDLGRTTGAPLDSTTFSGDTVVKVGTNQIGRYTLHLHHVNGPLPAKPRQFTLIGNRFERGEKWGGITLHNSHFGLMQDNVCVQPKGVCWVEEDGSETDNHWIGNYAGQSTAAPCDVLQYDPEGKCPAAFWLRGQNQILRNNVSEDM